MAIFKYFNAYSCKYPLFQTVLFRAGKAQKLAYK